MNNDYSTASNFEAIPITDTSTDLPELNKLVFAIHKDGQPVIVERRKSDLWYRVDAGYCFQRSYFTAWLKPKN